MKNIDQNYKERIERFLFETNWFEIPLFLNNTGKTIRFDVESKSETEKVKLIKDVFDDLFHENGKFFVIFYGSENNKWQVGKKYFKKFSLKKTTKKDYTPKEEDSADEKNYIVACMAKRKAFKINKFITEYLENNQLCQMAFANLRNGSAIQLYDYRGFDLFSEDKDFLTKLYFKHENDVLEYNREEIKEALKIN